MPLEKPLDYDEICRLLPHRAPFLLVDSILEWEPRQRCVGQKNLAINESFFEGHFSGYPVMPGVLIIEAMAQVAGLLALETRDTPTGFFYLAHIQIRLRHSVRPGDQLETEATLQSLRKSLFKTHVIGRVRGRTVAEGDLTFALADELTSADILRDTMHCTK